MVLAWQTQTEWHNIVVWRDVADIAQKLLKKGSLVYLEDKLKTRSYEDKDGTNWKPRFTKSRFYIASSNY